MADHHYDMHTLYVETGVAHREQIEKVFRIAILELAIPCRYKVNLVSNKDGYCGYAYIWISSPQVYFALIGKNIDGKERVIFEDDPNWTPPEKPLNDARREIEIDAKKSGLKGSWADDTEDEAEIQKLYTCPKIKRDLDPLVRVPGYIYDNEQQDYLKMRALEINEDPEDLQDIGYFEVAPAYVPDILERLCPNVLISRKIPDWITEEILKRLFSHYASDLSTLHRRCVNGKHFMDKYPYVNIYQHRDVRSVFITFDPSTSDARFALLMTRKVQIVDDRNRYDPLTLVFNHSFNQLQ